MPVREDSRIEGKQKGRHERPPVAHQPPGEKVNEEYQKNRDEHRHDARGIYDLVRVVAGFIEELRAHAPFGIHAGLPRGALRRKIRLEKQHRQHRERFYERRVFRIQVVIKIVHIAVASGNVRELVHDGRIRA